MDDDFWLTLANGPEDTSTAIAVQHEAQQGITPLDRQFGHHPRRIVPEGLEMQFDLVTDQGQLFAILDGAKIPDLPELLEASGLNHLCLFKGDALDDYGAIAPWIVQMDRDSDLLRHLFTKDQGPHHLWDHEAAIYLRAPCNLDALQRHFRRLVKLRREDQSWIFFRFWDPKILRRFLLLADSRSPLLRALLYLTEEQGLREVITVLKTGDLDRFAFTLPALEARASVPRLEGQDFAILTQAVSLERLDEMVRALQGDFPEELQGQDYTTLHRKVSEALIRMQSYGFRSGPLLYTLTAWELIYDAGFEHRDPTGRLLQTFRSHLSEQRKFRRIEQRLTSLFEEGVL
ncbi:DUF4123 domain-containing protein [Thioclava sp. GXIMD4215]|uniref:DUF4123 domain-containing protein n=1 Tax=Thioclava sp. GXIMD4215 TaxID=3131928 RepID=UPI00324FC368